MKALLHESNSWYYTFTQYSYSYQKTLKSLRDDWQDSATVVWLTHVALFPPSPCIDNKSHSHNPSTKLFSIKMASTKNDSSIRWMGLWLCPAGLAWKQLCSTTTWAPSDAITLPKNCKSQMRTRMVVRTSFPDEHGKIIRIYPLPRLGHCCCERQNLYDDMKVMR